MADIAERVARLEDRAELQDLIVRYFLAADGDDVAGLEACFTDDATFAISGAVCGASGKETIAFLVSERKKMGLTLHTPNYGLFTFSGADAASGLVGAHLELSLGGVSVFGAVRYQDTYRRIDGDWRILTRDMRVVHIAPWTDVSVAFASPHPVRWPGSPPAASDFPRPAS